MQSRLFVLIGLPNENSNADLAPLQEGLNRRFSNGNILLQFTRKEELLSARYEDVNFYVSLLKSKKELPDWFEMAKNFELAVNKSEVNEEELSKRYNKSIARHPNLYGSVHYMIGKEIFYEINSFFWRVYLFLSVTFTCTIASANTVFIQYWLKNITRTFYL